MITATHFHAMVVHFPIALLMVGFLSEMIAVIFKKPFFQLAALFLLLLGTLGTLVSYFAGNVAGDGIEGGSLKQAMDQHEQAAIISLWLAIDTAAIYVAIFIFKYRKKWARIVAVISFAILIGSITRTGYLGGQLVYKHGAGVKLALPDFNDPGIEKDE